MFPVVPIPSFFLGSTVPLLSQGKKPQPEIMGQESKMSSSPNKCTIKFLLALVEYIETSSDTYSQMWTCIIQQQFYLEIVPDMFLCVIDSSLQCCFQAHFIYEKAKALKELCSLVERHLLGIFAVPWCHSASPDIWGQGLVLLLMVFYKQSIHIVSHECFAYCLITQTIPQIIYL